MPGMNSGLNSNNPTVVAAFRAMLAHQGIIALILLVLLAVAWAAAREWLEPATKALRGGIPATPEPRWRLLLRIGFGVVWLFDGLLQAQPAMVLGMPSQVIEPTASASPTWVQHLVNWGGTTWSFHPVQASTAAVWIQLAIGAALLAAPRGTWSRLAGLASAGWGLAVWVFGESFGGIFAPGLTWLFGAPGAALFYCAAGVLIALPERCAKPQLGRVVLAVMGAFFAGMAVLQAWPGRGFWQGTSHGQAGTLTGMITSMAQTPQPRFLAHWVADFASFTAAHGFAVNLVAVIVLAAAGGLLITGNPRLLRPALIPLAVLCLADWVLVEDLGFFGGLGTDPNSMIPILLVVAAGYLALTQAPVTVTVPVAAEPAPTDVRVVTDVPVPAEAPADAPVPADDPGPEGTQAPGQPAGRRARLAASLRPGALAHALGTANPRAVLTFWTGTLILVGALPIAVAQASPAADPILAKAIAGSSAPLNYEATPFHLVDQYGKPFSPASLHGKVTLLGFLDPVCTSDCPLMAQEFREASQLLGAQASQVELVAIVLTPDYRSIAYLQAFDRQEQLNTVPNWHYLTGPLPELSHVWHSYGMIAEDVPAGAMVLHNDAAFLIDKTGHVRQEIGMDPGPGTQTTTSSFAALLANAVRQVLGSS